MYAFPVKHANDSIKYIYTWIMYTYVNWVSWNAYILHDVPLWDKNSYVADPPVTLCSLDEVKNLPANDFEVVYLFYCAGRLSEPVIRQN